MVGPVTAQPRCLLSGVVLDALTNQTLAKAAVFVDLEDSSSLPVRQVTGAEGKFCFENLTPGNYTVRAEHARYIGANYGERRPGGSGDLLRLDGRGAALLCAANSCRRSAKGAANRRNC